MGARRRDRRPVLAAAGCAAAVGALGVVTTDLGPWYQQLQKPAWQPPDWLFGPVWTLIFALCALSFILYWRRGTPRNARLEVIAAFALNAFLNTLWSLLFFRLRRPDWALYEVALLWLSIMLMAALVARASRSGAVLLTPYVVWVIFAALLNWKIVQLNAPFVHGG